ncbi:MAG: hypothetical protein ACYC27_13590 [Armatimonadota bacterium]
MRWFEKLQHIDTRIMYLLLAIVIAAPLIWRMDLPIIVSPAVQGAYDAVENMPDDKIAIISANWAAGTIAENQPQTEALMRHMFTSGKKFAILSFDIQGIQFATDISARLAKEYNKKYGVDYVNWGYRPFSNFVLLIQGMARNVHKSIGKDTNGTPISDIPMMKDIKNIKDIGLVAEVTPSATLEIWIGYLNGEYRPPIIYAPTAVMAPEGFNPLDAGQIKGMLTGMKGAAEYEKLLGRSDFATRGTGALSTSHLLIIVLIILGNVGYISTRRRHKKEQDA